jgi:4-amino-4-deoxy-L-arabinose transferase-like glycosyltransferase
MSLRAIRAVLWTLAIAALAVRFYLAWRPVPILIARYMADDAFYYLTIARHAAAGAGVTFDGLSPTNGFHPLYFALLVPIYRLVPSDQLLSVHLAMTLVMAVNALTAWPVYSIVRRLSGPTAGVVAAFAWLLNPWVILIAIQGVEQSIAALTAVMAIAAYLRAKDSRSGWMLTGAALGLAMLARSDMMFLALAIGVDALIRRTRITSLVTGALAAAVVLSPWLVWNLIRFGSILQVSGAAIHHATHVSLPTARAALGVSVPLAARIALKGALMSFQIALVGIPLLLFRTRPGVRAFGRVSFLFVWVAVALGFYACYLLHQQLWYFTPVIVTAAIVTGVAFGELTGDQPARSRGLAAVGLLAAAMACSAGLWEWRGLALRPAQADGYHLADWLARETPPSARIGAWNSGIIGYFANRTVVDLDGVVNNGLYAFVRERGVPFDLPHIREYIQATDIDYLTDYEDMFPLSTEAAASSWLVKVYERPASAGSYTVKVYRVIR